MDDNRSIIQKADLLVADMVANGGYLEQALAREFIEVAIDESTLMPLATTIPMKSHTHRLDKMRFGSRVLRAGTEGQALIESDRVKPDLSNETLQSQLFKAEARLTDEDLEDSIEGGSLRDTIIKLLGQAVARDMDEVVIEGDTTSGDPFLAKFDGAIKLANVNVVAAGSVPISKTMFKAAFKSLPTPFRRDRQNMSFFVASDSEVDYRDVVAERETGRGDQALEEWVPLRWGGIPIREVPLFPTDLGAGSDSVMLLTNPKNMNVGIWRQIKLETDRDISAGVLKVVITIRFGFAYTERQAVVKTTGVLVNN